MYFLLKIWDGSLTEGIKKLNMAPLDRRFLFETMIFGRHVNFPVSILQDHTGSSFSVHDERYERVSLQCATGIFQGN